MQEDYIPHRIPRNGHQNNNKKSVLNLEEMDMGTKVRSPKQGSALKSNDGRNSLPHR